jgi:hypothetical protein
MAKQKQTYRKKKTLKLEDMGCCGTDTPTKTAQTLWKQLDSDRYVCASLQTDLYGPLPAHQNTAVVSSSTRPIVNHTDSEKVVNTFSVPGIALGQGTSILTLKCV